MLSSSKWGRAPRAQQPLQLLHRLLHGNDATALMAGKIPEGVQSCPRCCHHRAEKGNLSTLRPSDPQLAKNTLRGFVRSSPASALLWPEGLKRAQDQYYHQRKTNLILRRAFDLL